MELPNFNSSVVSSLRDEKWCELESLYQYNGFWFRLPDLLGTKELLNNFKPRSTDVILASFPKTGTTWLKSILFSIIHRSSKEALTVKNPHSLIPTLEVQCWFPDAASTDFPSMDDMSAGSRIFSTHIPYQILADNLNSSECKIVYVTRDPRDTLISLWNYVNKAKELENNPWSLEMAVERFCSGIVPFGPYYDHVLGYRKQGLERPQKVFLISYEELMEEPKTHVKRLAQFLGRPFEGDDGEKEIEDIVRSCSFQTLSSLEVNKSDDCYITNYRMPSHAFFRRGQVGDHANFLKPEMIQRIDAITRVKFLAADYFSYGI